MYKFNLLEKINREKTQIKQRETQVKFFFFISVLASIAIIFMFYFKISDVNISYKKVELKTGSLKQKYDKFKSEDFLVNSKSRQFHNYYSKRVMWSSIFNDLAGSLNDTLALNSLIYRNDEIILDFLYSSKDSKSGVQQFVDDLKAKLDTSIVLADYISDDFEISNRPREVEREKQKNLWSFSLKAEMKEIINGFKEKKKKSKRKKRFQRGGK